MAEATECGIGNAECGTRQNMEFEILKDTMQWPNQPNQLNQLNQPFNPQRIEITTVRLNTREMEYI